jgi:hypothetical protein
MKSLAGVPLTTSSVMICQRRMISKAMMRKNVYVKFGTPDMNGIRIISVLLNIVRTYRQHDFQGDVEEERLHRVRQTGNNKHTVWSSQPMATSG